MCCTIVLSMSGTEYRLKDVVLFYAAHLSGRIAMAFEFEYYL
jgi:hypothetical protein